MMTTTFPSALRYCIIVSLLSQNVEKYVFNSFTPYHLPVCGSGSFLESHN